MKEIMIEALTAGCKTDLTLFKELIKKNASELSKPNEDGETFLHFLCCLKDFAPATKWVCENISLLDLSFDDVDNHGRTPLALAYETNNNQAIEILQPYTPYFDYSQWLVLRQLVCVFGNNLLLKNHLKIDSTLKNSAGGGNSLDSLQILNAAIYKFTENKNTEDKKKYIPILIALRIFYRKAKSKMDIKSEEDLKSYIEELINNTKTRKIYFYAGFQKHGFTASLKINDTNSYELTLYDENKINTSIRAIFNYAYFGEEQFIRRAIIPKDKIYPFLHFLFDSKNLTEKEFYPDLNKALKKAKAIVNFDKHLINSVHSMEENRCYWVNPLHATHDMFIDQLGKEQAKIEFNNFSKYIHEETLAHFKSTFEDECNPNAVKKLEEIQLKKDLKPFWTLTRKRYAIISLIILSLVISAFFITSGFGIPLVAPLFIGLEAAAGSIGASCITMGIAFLSFMAIPLYNAMKWYRHTNRKPSQQGDIPLIIEENKPAPTSTSYNTIHSTLPAMQNDFSEEKTPENSNSEKSINITPNPVVFNIFTKPKNLATTSNFKEEVTNLLWHVPATVAY